MFKVWLDDVRTPPDDSWMWVKTVMDLEVFMLTWGDKIDILSLDHDMGEREETGYDFLCWLEERLVRGDLQPEELPGMINVHSANPVGRERMLQAIRSIRDLQRGMQSSK